MDKFDLKSTQREWLKYLKITTMINKLKTIPTTVCLLGLIVFNSCDKEKFLPVVLTKEVSDILKSSAVSGGDIINDNGQTVISRGVCWSASIDPDLQDEITEDGAGAGSFTSSIIHLYSGTRYYVRAYATNSFGTGYGMTLSFMTNGGPPGAPKATTENGFGFISTGEATVAGLVNPNGAPTNVVFEYGLTQNYGGTAIATQSPVTEDEIEVSATLHGLSPEVEYHFRVKAVNDFGVDIGIDKTFKVDCMVCRIVSYENTHPIFYGTSATYCGNDLKSILAIPPSTVNGITSKWECK